MGMSLYLQGWFEQSIYRSEVSHNWKEGSPISAPVLGIDIAKQRIEVALPVEGKIKNKSFKNTAEGFEALSFWLRRLGMSKVQACLEATGNDGEELAIYLYEADHSVSMVNPARIKGFAQSELIRTKTDKMDVGIIARFCLAMRPQPWIPPFPEIRLLRALVRRADSLIGMLTQEKNRLGTAHESVIPLIQGHMDYLNKEIKKVRDQIAGLVDQNSDLRKKKELLASIPGVGKATIAVILAEWDNLEKFNPVRELVAFIGLAPKETLPGSSIKGKPRLCKVGHVRFRKALYMPALVSIQCNLVMMAFYHRLKEKGKNGKVIVCAIMRKLVHIIFGILKSGKKFDANYKPVFAWQERDLQTWSGKLILELMITEGNKQKRQNHFWAHPWYVTIECGFIFQNSFNGQLNGPAWKTLPVFLSMVTWIKKMSFISILLPKIFFPQFLTVPWVILSGFFLFSGSAPMNWYPFIGSHQ
jgi:transposase